jgi:large subunit ribosomal protein L7e
MAERYAIRRGFDRPAVPLDSRFAVSSEYDSGVVPEQVKAKAERNKGLAEKKRVALDEKSKARSTLRAELKKRTAQYTKEYTEDLQKLIEARREAKKKGHFFVEPEAKVVFVVRIRGIIKMAPKPRKVLQLLRLRQIHNGVFLKMNKPIMNMLKLVQPYVTLGYPSLKSIRELAYKRGFGKVNKQRIPLMDTDIISENLGRYGIHGHEDMIHELYTAGPNFKRVSNFLWPFKLSAPRKGFKCKRHGYNEFRGGDWGNRSEEINDLIARMN